jgi:bifunctional non-homologous end joining protein LigD
MTRKVIELSGRKVVLANLEKVLYPSCGFTKANVLEYYGRMAPLILPHLRDRALTLKRYPDGVEQEFFFEKRCPSHRPPWVQTADVRRDGGKQMTFCVVNDPATLLWVANLAALELHVPLARAWSPETPDAMVFDLDPGEPANILDCARVALILRALLARLQLSCVVKTSGLKGLHLLVPLNSPDLTFGDTRQFSRAIAIMLEKNYPDLVTAKMAKGERKGKVFINWSQNDSSLTMICVYSLRAREQPYVSFPLQWPALEQLAGQGKAEQLQVLHDEALSRTAKSGDLFSELLATKQRLFSFMDKSPSPSPLNEYRAKRTFETTPEPPPGQLPEERRLVFVVHKHAARALHYDLRLELAGVLKSWAVPKGPSLEPGVKRLAVRVEDHPFAYQDFEGVIPEGNYGAGSVIIWDRGYYRHPLARDEQENEQLLLAGLNKGDLKFILEGEKLRGEFALVKSGKDDRSWLLLKKKEYLEPPVGDILKENRSVLSGKTLEELLTNDSSPSFRQRKTSQIRRDEAVESEPDGPVATMPHHIRPMLATLAREPFDHPDWLFEVKWDGYRAIAELTSNGVELYSRNLLPMNEKFSPIVEALGKLAFEAVLDGEIVMVDDLGQPDFQLLQHYRQSGSGHLLYYVFDLLYFQGHDLTTLPLIKRKELLHKIIPPAARIRFSDHVLHDGVLFFQVARNKGLEGVVAKQMHSPYQPGIRSREWLKLKTRLTLEGVIAGFTPPRGGRKHFGTLVLGVYQGDELICIGHAGGGFGARDLTEIHARLAPLIQTECPFKVLPGTVSRATWVRPELVCEVEFHGWTMEGVMRQPVFLRLREDKSPREVIRENEHKGA